MNKYIISENGLGIAVGLIGDAQEALKNRTLAENIYGVETSENFFAGLIYMKSFRQFKKFLILKEYFRMWDLHWARNKVSGRRDKASVSAFTRRAIKQAKLIIESSVTHENFMRNIYSSSASYGVGSIVAENNNME